MDLSGKNYVLTRFVFLRLFGLVYLFAFLSLALQVVPLVGEHGLLPARLFLDKAESPFSAFIEYPTFFWFFHSDAVLQVLAWIGVALSLVVLVGYANVPILFVLWFLYLSFVHIGQLWYGYGWEMQLLETGFLALFLVPLIDARPFPRMLPPVPVIWLLRWLTFRVMFGAGLIKIRGDSCWKDFTCLFYHYETQPLPNPLSPLFHFLPQWIHRLGVLWNHIVELVVPFFVFIPRFASIAGVIIVVFHVLLIFSGNLSFLNYITIAAAVSCFNDTFLKKILPNFILKKADYSVTQGKTNNGYLFASCILVVFVVYLSIPVVQNLLSSHQAMNTSFNRLHLVNTYGAFGSVGKERYELIVEGTLDEEITPHSEWRVYEFIAKPGNVSRALPVVAPYQPRLDWQIWFAAMQSPEQNPWLIHLVWKLLHNDEQTLHLLAGNPFSEQPPHFIRVRYYRYAFNPPGSDDIWTREYVGEWLQPLSIDTSGLRAFVEGQGWK